MHQRSIISTFHISKVVLSTAAHPPYRLQQQCQPWRRFTSYRIHWQLAGLSNYRSIQHILSHGCCLCSILYLPLICRRQSPTQKCCGRINFVSPRLGYVSQMLSGRNVGNIPSQGMIYCQLFCVVPIISQMVMQCPCTRSTPPPNIPPTGTTNFQLVVVSSFYFRPLMAKSPFPLYFSMCVVSWCPPNKPAYGGVTKPDHWRLLWDHRRLQCHVLWAPLTYPRSERVKPQQLILVVVCFVVCIVVASTF